ncbi:type I polyketide synthase [Corynebacterium sp. HMSC078H07]|uniref:type I polyketide synthase n=1 Tax=Corynebacterium sp. HMSC078H07 TaxID=1739379 RepID=UPI000B2E3ABD|nr:type I polyketide synthase [Corynebacterium sp. HMSC078H07]
MDIPNIAAPGVSEAPYALSFSGQGFAWLPTLREALAAGVRPQIATYLADAEEILAPLGAALLPSSPHGFAPLAWAEAEPGFALSSPAASTPGIVCAQLAVLESVRAQGLDTTEAVLSIGHSQGVLAAAVASGRATPAEALAIARLIGAALTTTARIHGLVRTAQGAPMVAVDGATREQLHELGAHIGLINGRERSVIVGTPEELARVRRSMADEQVTFTDLDVDAAFHHPALAIAVEQVERWAAALELDAMLAGELACAVLTDTVDWPARVAEAVAAGARWILEVGPTRGVEPLTREAVAGRGVGTLAVGTAEGQTQLFEPGRAPAVPASWSDYAPRLVGGRLSTRFTETTGYSPVMLPGMTPTTVDPAIVAAAANAGHWAELAGGGQHTDDILNQNLERLARLLAPGVNAQFNALYLSASQWRRQIEGQRAIPRARAAGAPLNGVVISAGIPPHEEACDLVRRLHAENFPWVAFKPGTVEQIKQVLAIARTVPTPLIMQVEGGQAGGHHSAEDLDELLAATYNDIRRHPNVLLAVGGGIATPAQGAEYLTGEWSRRIGLPAAPVDAIMIGTAAMATAESTASESVKQTLVAATEHDVISGRSDLGASIHELDNSFACAGRLLDAVAGDEELVSAHREEISAALARTCKPYFGDLDTMNYAEWLQRYVELSFHDGWADESWCTRFEHMVARTEARLHEVDHGEITLQVTVDSVDPAAAIDELVELYGDAALHPTDAAWFVSLVDGPGKPPGFVPIIDAAVRRRFRQDSLWQAHDEHFDADSVCIIPGTAGVEGIERANEPVAQLLKRFEQATIDLLSAAPTPDLDAPVPSAEELIRQAPCLNWAGREQANPLRLNLSGATLESVSTDSADFWFTVPLGLSARGGAHGGADADAALRVRITAPSVPGASPVVSAEDAASAMRELARVAAGGTLPEVDHGSATVTATLDAAHFANYVSVTSGGSADGPVVPDVLVGTAWPAVFAVIAEARTASDQGAAGEHGAVGEPVVEGLLNLVHLEHSLELVDGAAGLLAAAAAAVPGADPLQVQATARLRGVWDTLSGREVEVAVNIEHEGNFARLRERFLIPGRTGTRVAPGADDAADGLVEFVRETPRSFRHRLTVTAPDSMRPFAVVTGDHNPIHTSANAAALAGLDDGPIAHGMWTSALAQTAAAFDGTRVLQWSATMLAPVRPGSEVELVVDRVGVDKRSGHGEVRSVTASSDGVVVLEARATMSTPRTFYAFPGQGIQAPGMGMQEYGTSPAARAVWERADAHTRQHLGFSILEIVRNNPDTVAVRGTTYSHPDGVLYLTQFTQVAMATLGCAQIAALKEAGVLDNTAAFGGHSVGEYNALAAYAEVLSLEAVLEIVYVRGLTMDRLVERDAEGYSRYGLGALRPHKMGMRADEVTDYIAETIEVTGEFLEVVNYNVAGRQYAIAGTVDGLIAIEENAEHWAPGQRAFVPIPGIDVPFHSSRLVDGVDDFRAHLDELIPQDIDLDVLVGRYIPNLVARPFAVDRDFVEAIADVVDSPRIAAILEDFAAAAEHPQKLGRTLLVELLAWQFASPVRWIETQDLLLTPRHAKTAAGLPGLGIERFVEVGVGHAPTVANMMGQTLSLPEYDGVQVEVLNTERDHARVFAEDTVTDSVPARETVPADEHSHPAQPTPQLAADELSATHTATPLAATEKVTDQPLSSQQAVEMLIALWTKVRPDQIAATDTIEGLVEGVSSRRNQLLLDLGVEFGIAAIDGAADMPVSELAQTVAQRAPGYHAFGPVLTEQVAQAVRRVTGPAGKKPGYIAERVNNEWGLGPGWVDHTLAELVLGSREGVSLRGGELATLPVSAATTVKGLDELIDASLNATATRAGVTVARVSHASADTVVDPAALAAYTERLESALEDSARSLLGALGREDAAHGDDSEHGEEAVHDKHLAELVSAELGPDWAQRVAPAFDAKKAVLFDDCWAYAREGLVRAAAAGVEDPPLDVLGAGAEVARMAEYLGYHHQAVDAEVPGEFLLHSGQVAVVTGGSPGSIGAEIISELLVEGATVIATTSQLTPGRLEFFKELYRTRAVGTAALWVVPANLNSFADIDALVEWIGSEQTATVGGKTELRKPAFVPDLLFPFAAPRVSGTVAEAGPEAEAQMRLLLWSVEKLIAGLSALGADTHLGHRLHVVLPGSPNRGRFGGDGAYGEAKAAFDALVQRWHSEQNTWGARTSLVHALIGWVRGTGLMAGNDPLVEQVEARGVSTFSAKDMAMCLVDNAANEDILIQTAEAPVVMDFTGGLAGADLDFAALARDAALGDVSPTPTKSPSPAPRTVKALPNVLAPLEWTTPSFDGVSQSLEDMVVIVGAGELGPLGTSRTRFEAEVSGDLSATGVLELAWSRGLVTWDDSSAAWTTPEGEEIAEEDIYDRFHDEVLAGIGVRRFHDDFGPHLPMVDNLAPELTTIYLEKPITFAVEDEATAQSFVDSCEGATMRRVLTSPGGEAEWQVTRPAGSAVRVPRRVAMTRFVGGQIPEGFDPAVYGIPADMLDSVDRLALWNLVCTIEAFLAAGFSPAELLAHVHPARVSSTQGTGMAGQEALRSLYVDKLLAHPRQHDILQEALPNVIAAHVMQSYVGGYGQMVHPVAACATAAVSVEAAVDKLRLHKADFVVAGGIDALSVEGITGFGDMAATADSSEMEAKGIEHRFFSRANDRRRGGFVESEGGGTLLLARGSLAAELGLPVLGVVGFAESFADGAHTSIPAPGLGALSAARGGAESRLARSLQELGVAPDDIAVVSKHDTSTSANDPNESDLHERIARALGRSDGNPLYVISQKTLTGHAKGGAAAFQLIGLCQVLRGGIVPPNRSLDCVDPELRRHEHLVWLRQPLDLRRTPPKAGLVTSLGFGHVSALIAVVHPEAFMTALVAEYGEDYAQAWRDKAEARERSGLRRLEEAMRGGPALYQRPVERNLSGGDAAEVKEREAAVLLSEGARMRNGVLEPDAERG